MATGFMVEKAQVCVTTAKMRERRDKYLKEGGKGYNWDEKIVEWMREKRKLMKKKVIKTYDKPANSEKW